MSKIESQRRQPAVTAIAPRRSAAAEKAQDALAPKSTGWLKWGAPILRAGRPSSTRNPKVDAAMKPLIARADASPVTSPQPSAADIASAPSMKIGGRSVYVLAHAPTGPNDPGSLGLWVSGKSGDPAGTYRKIGDAQFPLNPSSDILSNPTRAFTSNGGATSGYSLVAVGKTPFLLTPQTSTAPSELFAIA